MLHFMKIRFLPAFCLVIITILCFRCSKPNAPVFDLLNANHTHVDFENTITESDSFNVLKFEYIYNGGGVGIGDFNNDSLPDLYFAGNMVSSKMYLNTGDLQFLDVTEVAKVSTKSWCTGVAVHDFDQDGWMDIYVSTVNPDEHKTSANLLFMNKGLNEKGVPVFEESAASAGLSANAYSTQATFLDYDLDGDLDMYLVTNSLEEYPKNNPVGQNDKGEGKSQDKFYRNDSDSLSIHFTDVSKDAGILTEGWGLGVTVSDINLDGYPDIYVTNDFISNDHLYINNQDGTFTNQIKNFFNHTEFNGMGIDVADINNDGLNDILAVDMMPDDNLRQKTMFSNTGYSKFQLNHKQKYLTQYVRNVLQLNNGNNTFSDIGYLSGISATDWSWSALIADFDNDGWRDILITNGYKKDITDLDFVTYMKESTTFGTAEDKYKSVMKEVNKLNGVNKNNLIFKNNGDLTFGNKSNEWGLTQSSYSNGAAYADLDRDGDLDLVMNNIDAPAFIYRNNTREKNPLSNYLDLELIGENKNKSSIGAKVWLYSNGKMLFAELATQRGFKSTVDHIVHFGLGSENKIDSLKIVWPSGKWQLLKAPSINQQLSLNVGDAYEKNESSIIKRSPHFSPVANQYGLTYKHSEEDFVDFKQSQPLLLHKFSQSGPPITVGDINGDGLQDILIGGSSNQGVTLFRQKNNNTFQKSTLPVKREEDVGVLLFDADGDSDLDLFCVSGSSEFDTDLSMLKHRVYVNDGNGNFSLDNSALPKEVSSAGSCVVSCDYDKDGDLDLFVGGRVRPNHYPETPESFLLRNESTKSKINFSSVALHDLKFSGMITGACWVDFDNDQWMDLVVVGEWMPVTFFKNERGTLKKLSDTRKLPNQVGWWRNIKSADFDNDGDMDFIVGNLGLNSIYKASSEEPVSLYAKDFDGNGSVDPIMSRYILGKEYPIHPRETMTEQIVSLRRVLTSYAKYGESSLEDLLSSEQLKGAQVFHCDHLASSYIENLGNGNFKLKALPIANQTSPMNDFLIEDIDQDGNQDILVVQNDFSFEPLAGWYDAGIGLVLKGDGKGNFANVPVRQSNFYIRGDAKTISKIETGNKDKLYLISQNQDSLIVLRRND